MKLEIIWSFPALATFYRIHWRTAEIVDRAVLRFAEFGEGPLAWEPPYYHLYAGPYDALLAIDRNARTLTVLFIYRARL